jgi:hypothetical protein
LVQGTGERLGKNDIGTFHSQFQASNSKGISDGKSRDEDVGAYRILFRVPTQYPDFKMPV